MGAHKLIHMGSFYVAPGYSTEYIHTFLATELYTAPLDQDDDEYIEIVKLPMSEVEQRLAAGELHDGKTLAMLALVRAYLTL